MIDIIYDKYTNNYSLMCNGVLILMLTKSELVGLGIKMLDAAGVPNV